jgi:hypothetical protein
MRNLDQMQQPIKESLSFGHIVGLWACAIYSKKQAQMKLKKTTNDA